jgi:hypothetical protein
MSLCPVYTKSNCVIKTLNNPQISSVLFDLPIIQIKDQWDQDCGGDTERCCFVQYEKEIAQTESFVVDIPKTDSVQVAIVEKEQTTETEAPKPKDQTKISLHKIDNPFLVKADILVYVQNECDTFRRPIKMGGVYITGNGGDLSSVKSEKIFHAVVAGESRLVNEEDIKMSTRKSLHLAENYKARNIVMMPADCGTHDINDTARVQLSAIKTYLQSNKNCSLANIFIVMEDEESFVVYQEYYNRIFKK